MIKKLIIVLILLGAALAASSQNRDYFVAFCSKAASRGSLAGHAFVAIGKGDPFTCSVNVHTEAWGLYAAAAGRGNCKPASLPAGKSFFVGPVPGCLYSDVRTNMDNVFVVRCGWEDYLSVLGIIGDWKQKKYELKEQDCLSFVIAVAGVFRGRILIPERKMDTNFPNRYIVELKRINGK